MELVKDMHSLVLVLARESLKRYVNDRVPTGGFLRAVLEHDLFEAVGRADANNMKIIPEIVRYIYNELPSVCHGDKYIVNEWLKGGG